MKRIFFISVLVVSLLIINNLVRAIYSLWQKKDLITKAQTAVEKEKKENSTLKKQWEAVNKPGYVEEQARDKLFMGKQGEQVVLLPKNALQAAKEKKESPKPQPYWRQWWELFF